MVQGILALLESLVGVRVGTAGRAQWDMEGAQGSSTELGTGCGSTVGEREVK